MACSFRIHQCKLSMSMKGEKKSEECLEIPAKLMISTPDPNLLPPTRG